MNNYSDFVGEDIYKKSRELLDKLGIHEDEDEERETERRSEEGPYKAFDIEEFRKSIKQFK